MCEDVWWDAFHSVQHICDVVFSVREMDSGAGTDVCGKRDLEW